MKKTTPHILSFSLVIGGLVAASMLVGQVFAATSPTPSPKPSASPKISTSPSPSPLASPSSAPATDTTQRLKDRIDKVIEKRRDQVKGIIDEMSSEKRGFVGEIQRVTEKTISVKTVKGEQEVFTVDGSIPLVKDNKRITIDDVAVGDWTIVMGYVGKDGMEIKKILISSTSLMPRSYETSIGNIKTLGTSQVIVITRPNQDAKTYVLNKTTQYQDSNGNTSDKKSLREQDQVLVISYTDKNSQIAHTVKLLAPR